jgi:hypothetical protein
VAETNLLHVFISQIPLNSLAGRMQWRRATAGIQSIGRERSLSLTIDCGRSGDGDEGQTICNYCNTRLDVRVRASWRHFFEMPPYALLLHSVPAHTPNGIPRTESRGTSARSTCTTASHTRLPGVCLVVRDQELRAARELAEAHVPRPVLHHPCLCCVHCLRRCRRHLRPEPRPPHRAL